ncbi:MAG TPA: hypothetical protein VMZ66_07835 [Aeromicrobium sp.]|nr:hypothetical protein [Aeromicrobium sp.]
MIEVNEPQVWTLIGVFAAGLFGMLTLMSSMFLRVLKAEIGGLEARLTGKIDALDRDVQAIARHVFGEPGA